LDARILSPRPTTPLQRHFIIHPSSFILFTMLGSTLSNDPLADKRFDFQFVTPPYGYEWSKDFGAVTTRRELAAQFSLNSLN